MYEVYLWADDKPQGLIASFDSLRGAYDFARKNGQGRRGANRVRIRGPIPSQSASNSHTRAAQGDSPRQYWLVLDRAQPTHGAIRASAILQRIEGDRRELPASAGDPSITKTATNPDSQRHAPERRGRYVVVRDSGGQRQTVREGFVTLDEARDYIKQYRNTEHDPQAVWIAVATRDDQSARSKKPPIGVRSRFRRGVPRLRGWLAGSKRQHKRHDWEVDDRKTDASLAVRSEEELGLGIPAQWGKGRRSRKGEYIP